MKKILALGFCVLILTFGYSQKGKKQLNENFQIDTSKVNEFELDVTNVLKLAIVSYDYGYFQQNIGTPYLLTYRRYLSNNWDVHTGFGISGYKSNQVTNDTTNLKTGNLNLNLGIGFSHYIDLGKKVKLFYGSDLLYTFNQTKDDRDYGFPSNVENLTNKSTSNSSGIVPFLGVQFYVSKRISIASQTSLSLLYTIGNRTSSVLYNDGTPTEETKVETNSFKVDYNVPLNIKMRMRF